MRSEQRSAPNICELRTKVDTAFHKTRNWKMKQYLVPWNKDMYTQHPPQRVYGRGAHRIDLLARVSGRSIRVSYRKVLAQTQSDWVSRALQNLLITYVYMYNCPENPFVF